MVTGSSLLFGGRHRSLEDVTRAMLAGRSVSLDAVAAQTGLGRRWLENFARGRQGNFAATRVERLYDYFAVEPLSARLAVTRQRAAPLPYAGKE